MTHRPLVENEPACAEVCDCLRYGVASVSEIDYIIGLFCK